ncbi:MAG: hypothetical protein MI810_01035, partial [Flavobacteriales bacterium]|nr:hypothetical protein [Flavobacteriales bacterium]
MEEIEQKIRDTYKELAKKSSIMPREIPYLFFTSRDNGTPHIEYTEDSDILLVQDPDILLIKDLDIVQIKIRISYSLKI